MPARFARLMMQPEVEGMRSSALMLVAAALAAAASGCGGSSYLHGGNWNGRQVVPAGWVEQSTTNRVADALHEYGYLWWLDRADGYAYMAGLYGQLAAVVPDKDLVEVVTAHLPAATDATAVARWLLEAYILRAAR